MSLKKYLFIDRDGTLIEEPSDFQIDSVEKFKLVQDVIPSLLALKAEGYRMVMVTNQDGLGSEKNPQGKFDLIQALLIQILESQGIIFEKTLICPHYDLDHCICRKPAIGLVKEYLAMPDLDRLNSRVIGDRKTDVLLAQNMGLEGILLGPELGWKQITTQLLKFPRIGRAFRKTNETEIRVVVDLDQEAGFKTSIHTGIGFFDHMLEQLSKHGGFALDLQVKGDLHIDEHHTVEDTALALGEALRVALGDKVGIARYGFYLPMDDASSLAEVAIDLSGRSYFKFEGKFEREYVGELATEMVSHFFKSLADGLHANIHLKITGENNHHKVESAFKAVGRSLRSAIKKTKDGSIPSTKGSL